MNTVQQIIKEERLTTHYGKGAMFLSRFWNDEEIPAIAYYMAETAEPLSFYYHSWSGIWR